MVGTAFELGHAVIEIAGNGTQSPARQIRQQAHGNFMGTEDLERKSACRIEGLVKVSQERLFKTGKVDDRRTDRHLVGCHNVFRIIHQLLPDEPGGSGGSQRTIGYTGNACHCPGNFLICVQTVQINLYSGCPGSIY